MKNKKLTILGVLSILWGILYFCYSMFFPTSLIDWLGGNYFLYSKEQISQYKEGLNNLITNLESLFLIFLIIFIILVIVKLKKINVKVSTNSSVIAMLIGLGFHLFGLRGISWIFIIISGILLILYKQKRED